MVFIRGQTNLTFLETLISKYDFGPVKLPGVSRNGHQGPVSRKHSLNCVVQEERAHNSTSFHTHLQFPLFMLGPPGTKTRPFPCILGLGVSYASPSKSQHNLVSRVSLLSKGKRETLGSRLYESTTAKYRELGRQGKKKDNNALLSHVTF